MESSWRIYENEGWTREMNFCGSIKIPKSNTKSCILKCGWEKVNNNIQEICCLHINISYPLKGCVGIGFLYELGERGWKVRNVSLYKLAYVTIEK